MRVVGAGLGRTGTTSLKIALEQLLGGPCYHFDKLFVRPEDAEVWLNLIDDGRQPPWQRWLAGYRATLDWPAAAFWEDIANAFPDALVLLSTRSSTAEWYASYAKTIVPILLGEKKYRGPAYAVARRVTYETFSPDLADAEAIKRAYEQHNARVRATVPAERLIEWRPEDGWGPICAALGIAAPRNAFPRANTAEEFRVGTKLERKRLTVPQRAARKWRHLTRR
jgi:hypothetical protein